MSCFSIRDYEEKYQTQIAIQANIAELVQAAQEDRLLSRYNKFIVQAAHDFIYFVQHPEELYTSLDEEQVYNIVAYTKTIILHALIAIIAELKPGENIALPIYSNPEVDINSPQSIIQDKSISHYHTYYSYLIPFILRVNYSGYVEISYNVILILHYDHFINESSIYYNYDYHTVRDVMVALNILEERFPRIKATEMTDTYSNIMDKLYNYYLTTAEKSYLHIPRLSNYATYFIYLSLRENIYDIAELLEDLDKLDLYFNGSHFNTLRNYANINALLRKIKPARRADTSSNLPSLIQTSRNLQHTKDRWDILVSASKGKIIRVESGWGELNDIILLQVAKYGLHISYDLYEIFESFPFFIRYKLYPSILLQMGFPYGLIMTLAEHLQQAAIFTAVIERWSTQNLIYHGYQVGYNMSTHNIYIKYNVNQPNDLQLAGQIHDHYAYLYKINMTSNAAVLNYFKMTHASLVIHDDGK